MAEATPQDYGLPPEYLAELEAAQRKRAMAQMLVQQTVGYKPPEQTGRIATKISPLAFLANGIAGGLAGETLNRADKDISGVRSRFAADEQKALADYTAQAPVSRLQTGLASRSPGVRKLAGEERKSAEATRNAVAPGLVANGNVSQGLALAGGADISTITPQEPKQPELITRDDPNNPGKKIVLIRSYDAKGAATDRPLPAGMSITNVLPGKEAEFGLGQLENDLKGRKEGASQAKGVLEANARAVDALELGAQAGPGQDIFQAARSVGQVMGIPNADKAPTEQLGMALGERILADAAKLKPISDTDMKNLKVIVGTIGTDPTAITRALAYSNALALKSLSGYNQYVTEQQGNLKTDYARNLFSGAGSGFELPNQLSGPTQFQLEQVRQAKLLGVDISSMFLDPVTKQPMDPGARFNINPAGGFPGIAQTTQADRNAGEKKVDKTGITKDGKTRVIRYTDGTTKREPI